MSFDEVLIESDWNLKYDKFHKEIKESVGINRIRLEFKVQFNSDSFYTFAPVLIESDWNLKEKRCFCLLLSFHVLIESDWNLKYRMQDKRV